MITAGERPTGKFRATSAQGPHACAGHTHPRARFLPYLLTIAIAWLPWLILTWPGSMRDDTLAQYLQSSGLHHYYTQHPLFDTLTFALFWHIGSALGSPLIGQALYAVTQAVLLAAGINPHRTDETFRTLREHPRPTAAQRLAALRIWVQRGLAHPVEYVVLPFTFRESHPL